MKKRSFSIQEAIYGGFNAAFDNLFALVKLYIAGLIIYIPFWYLFFYGHSLSFFMAVPIVIFQISLTVLTIYGFSKALLSIYETGDFSFIRLYTYADLSVKYVILGLYFAGAWFFGLFFFLIPAAIWYAGTYFFDISYLIDPKSMLKSFADSIELTDGVKFDIYLFSWMIWGILFGAGFISGVVGYLMGTYTFIGQLISFILHPAIFFARIHAYRQLKGESPGYGLKRLEDIKELEDEFAFDQELDEFGDDFE